MTDSDLSYWIAFSHIKGLGAVRFRLLLDRFDTLETAWKASLQSLIQQGIPVRLAALIVEGRRKLNPSELADSILQRGIQVLRWSDPAYPVLLRQIEAPPPILYYRGEIPAESGKMLAIIGTRRMTSYGASLAREISTFLSANGVIVVSGMARGVDSIAHAAALDAGGRTLAVLGCGVDVVYPPENRSLAARIEAAGALISDYPPGTPPDRVNFPPRNRIISGMSSACIVIEAGERSGALITARFAAEQGREVFVVPGNVNAPQSVGTNRLIRDGAQPLLQKEDLLAFLDTVHAEQPVFVSRAAQLSFENPLEQEIVGLITNEALHADEIARRLNLPSGKIASALTLLEIKGFIIETASNVYHKNQTLL